MQTAGSLKALETLVADPAEGPLEMSQAAGWLLRLAKSLDAIHAQRRAHGALSAAVILAEERSPFGQGKLLAANGQASLAYRSPERGAHGPPSAADDRWACAVLLHFLLTGALPDAARTLPALAATPDVQAFLQGCFAVAERDRPASAAALCAAMERLIGVGSSLGPLEMVGAPGQGAPLASRFGGGALLLAAGGALGLILFVALLAPQMTGPKLNKPTPGPDVPDEPAPPASTLAVPVLSADAPELRMVPTGQCLERVLGEGVEVPDAQASFCGARDALVLVSSVRTAVKGKPSQKKWDALGWYDLPAAVALQARCCPLVFAPTVDTPPSCATDEALRSVQVLARKRPRITSDDPTLLAAAKVFGTAATCSSKRFSDTKKAHRASVSAADEAAFLAVFGEL